ncbi:MAG: glycosyltransferase family 87 protein [Alphaproteobacteria bacterium]
MTLPHESKFKSFFADAGWLNARRLIAYPRIFVTLYVIAIVIVLAVSSGGVVFNKPVGTDFLMMWTSGKMVNEGRAAEAYDYKKQLEAQATALPWKQEAKDIPFYAWLYPPMFLCVAALLAFLPYLAALAVWQLSTLPAYLLAVRGIVKEKGAMMAALGFPGVFVNLGHGHNGFLSAGLFGGALLFMEKRPYVAGALLGLLAYKPQFGLLVPLALLAGWEWRAIVAATITVLLTAAASCRAFGIETWRAFFESLSLTRGFILEAGPTGWEKIQSVFAASRMLGLGVAPAYVAQAIFALAAAIVVWMAWRQKDAGLRGAALVLGTLMATPYVLDYDMVMLALPIAFMAAIGLKDGFRRWEKIILAAAWLLPLVSRITGKFIGVPLAPFVMGLLLWVVYRRLRPGRPLPAV